MPHELPELVSVVFEVSDEDTSELKHAAQANLQGLAVTAEARKLAKELAERYPRQGDAKGRHYARIKTKAAYENTNAAFLAELLSAYADERRGRWLRCSLDKDWFKGKRVTYRMFDDVWKALLEFSRTYKCQMFVSTHSSECIEAAADLAQETPEDFSIMRTVLEKGQTKVRHFGGDKFVEAQEEHVDIR